MDDEDDAPRRPGGGKTLVGILGVSAAIAAVVQVASMESGRKVTATVAPSGHIVTRQISGHEYLAAYRDVGGVWTACDGIAYVKANARFTPAQCDAMLEAKLTEEADHVMRCTPGLAGPGHDNERVAATLLAHNIGWAGYCRSSIARLANARQYRAAAERFLRYDVAAGRHVPGLHARRLREQAIWMKDVH